MLIKSAFFSVLVLALFTFTGCDRDCCCAPQAAPVPGTAVTKESPPKSEIKVLRVNGVDYPMGSLPKVTGKWEGRWESKGHPGHGGGLKCDATEAGPQKWAAVFTAEFGPTKAYNVKLEGKPGDGKVLFGGNVDLGQNDGGVFTWKGNANATEFNGEYSGGGDTGTFKMTRPK